MKTLMFNRNVFNVKEILKATIVFLLTIEIIAVLNSQIQILVNVGDSLPEDLFLRCHKILPKLNNYSVVKSTWYKRSLIKKIVGVAGDRVWYDSTGQLFVNQKLIGKPYSAAKDGRDLHPIKAQIIPSGFVFLAGMHERSFDSRYQELGLVSIKDLEGLAIPLL